LEKLFVAGEDAGGTHGANRLGGNGICESAVFGRQAGKALAKYLVNGNRSLAKTRKGQVEEIIDVHSQPMKRSSGTNPFELRKTIQELNWNKTGIARNGSDLKQATTEIEAIADEAAKMRVEGGRIYNMMYTTACDVRSMIDVSRMVVAASLMREETRGAHFRIDFPKQRDDYGLFNNVLKRGANGLPEFEKRSVIFKHKSLEACQKHRKA
jgi:succinate dehydrogenase/fumarate reductase flavoprotein subunit